MPRSAAGSAGPSGTRSSSAVAEDPAGRRVAGAQPAVAAAELRSPVLCLLVPSF